MKRQQPSSKFFPDSFANWGNSSHTVTETDEDWSCCSDLESSRVGFGGVSVRSYKLDDPAVSVSTGIDLNEQYFDVEEFENLRASRKDRSAKRRLRRMGAAGPAIHSSATVYCNDEHDMVHAEHEDNLIKQSNEESTTPIKLSALEEYLLIANVSKRSSRLSAAPAKSRTGNDQEPSLIVPASSGRFGRLFRGRQRQ